jgi:hypothetical protein
MTGVRRCGCWPGCGRGALDLLRTRQPPAGGLIGVQRVIAAYLAAGWTRDEAGTELGLAYRGVAHHVVKARIILQDAPGEPSLIHRALRSGALPVPRGLPAPRRALTTGERQTLHRLANGTVRIGGNWPDTVSSLIAALDARTPTHTIALGWAAGLLGPNAPSTRAASARPPGNEAPHVRGIGTAPHRTTNPAYGIGATS